MFIPESENVAAAPVIETVKPSLVVGTKIKIVFRTTTPK